MDQAEISASTLVIKAPIKGITEVTPERSAKRRK